MLPLHQPGFDVERGAHKIIYIFCCKYQCLKESFQGPIRTLTREDCIHLTQEELLARWSVVGESCPLLDKGCNCDVVFQQSKNYGRLLPGRCSGDTACSLILPHILTRCLLTFGSVGRVREMGGRGGRSSRYLFDQPLRHREPDVSTESISPPEWWVLYFSRIIN